jgi:hypothetical protein
MPGSHNVTNILQRSPPFAGLSNGKDAKCNLNATENEYDMRYNLVGHIHLA